MTKPNDNLVPYLTALQHLRDAESQGIEPLQRQDDCPQPSDLMQVALGQAATSTAAQVEKHATDCLYCRAALRSLRSALADEPLPEMPEDVGDSVGDWIVSGETVSGRG